MIFQLWNIPDRDQRLLIVPTKATFAMHGNCNTPLTGPRFVFSRDISTSRYRCVCKSAGIISQMREADYKHPMNKNTRGSARQWLLRVSLLTMARSSPRYFPPMLQQPYMYTYICAYCIPPWYSLCMIKSRDTD